MSTAKELYQAGRLDEAIAALNSHLKSKPGAIDERVFLAELLIFAGNLERADVLLDQVGVMNPELTVALALFRQLVRAEKSRSEVFGQGRVPEFIGTPPDWLSQHLQALLALREGRGAEAVALIAAADAVRPEVKGHHGEVEFAGLRDLADTTAGFFEVLTSTGKYFWLPFERVREVEFKAPAQTRDLYWRQCTMVVEDGPEGDVFVPVLYPGSHVAEDYGARLGRLTDWVEVEDQPVRGLGQRCFLVGEEVVPILDLTTLVIEPV